MRQVFANTWGVATMITIKIELYDQEDAEELVLQLVQILDGFDEYIIGPRIRKHFDRAE